MPVFMGSAYKNKGVQLLLDGVTDYLPAPLEVVNEGLDLNNDEEKLRVGGSPGASPNSNTHTHTRSSGKLTSPIHVRDDRRHVVIAGRAVPPWNAGASADDFCRSTIAPQMGFDKRVRPRA